MLDGLPYVEYVDIQTPSNHHTTTVDLGQCIKTILARYEFDQLQAVPTPMVHDVKLLRDDCLSTDLEKEQMD